MLVPGWLAAQPLGDLEEPGQVERLPVAESSTGDSASAKATQEPEEILPGSEAVDPSLDEAPAPEAGAAGDDVLPAESGDSAAPAEAAAAPEAEEILPGSEAVDPTIDEPKEPAAPEQVAEPEKPEERAPKDPEQTDRVEKVEKAEAPAEPQWQIRWQNAFVVERVDDPRFQFLFGGRVQNDWGVYQPDNDLKDEFGGDGNGTKFRRARLYFQGQFFRYGFFKVEYDFAGDDGTDFQDVYMGLNLPNVGLIRVGHFKEPFSLEFQNSSNFIPFNERSPAFVFTPGRNTGFMLNRNLFLRNSALSVAFFRRTDELGEGFSDKEDYHLTIRLTGVPWYEENGARLLHLEMGYSHQFADEGEGTRYAIGAANDFSPNLVDTGTLAVDDVDLLNWGFAWVEHSLSLQSETTVSIPRDGINENPIFWGTYAEISWWITGEYRRYLRGRGVFSRVVPKSRFDPEAGNWGAFELATRYAWLDLSNDGIRGGTLSEWSLALNWVLFSNFRMNNNFVLSQAKDRAGTQSGLAYSWVTRFEIDF